MSRLIAIEGYNNDYFVSDEGDIYSCKYNQQSQLKPRMNKRGYLYVNLCKNGKSKSVMIHRLVAKYFLPDFNETLQVNHKDGIKTNNNISNLEMVTQTENMKHAVINKLLVNPKGEKHWCVKLTEKEVVEIRQKYKNGCYTQQNLAEQYNVSRECIKLIINNKTWKHI